MLKRVGVLSAGKVMGAMYLVIGDIAGVFIAVATMLDGNADNAGGAAASIFLVVLVPVLYAIGGFIGRILMAALYNFIVPMIGGLELDLQPPTTEF